MNGNTVLITGISGFIANHCAVELLNAGYRVRGSLRSLGRAGQVKGTLAKHADVTNLELAEADLESDTGWDKALAGCAHALHVASPFSVSQPEDEQVLIRPAVEGTLRVLRAARNFVREHASALHYSSVNPGCVLGPVLSADIRTSAEIIEFQMTFIPATDAAAAMAQSLIELKVVS
jgi:nucleoside-diphosphate-sugar epimerase